jgi:microsomal dipeptidase-like Zn-dependent dipeptidase
MGGLGVTRRTAAIAVAAGLCLLAAPGAPGATQPVSRFGLANHCLALRSVARNRFVQATAAGGYRASRRRAPRAAGFYLKPTGLGTYMLQDRSGKLMTADGSGGVGRGSAPGPAAEWRPAPLRKRRFAIASTVDGRQLAVRSSGDLTLVAAASAGRSGTFAFVRAHRCTPFPEAELGARGKTFRGRLRDGTVYGFADMHLHMTADMRAGGNVIYGESFDRFGIGEALGHDDRAHGPDGSLDATGNLLRSGSPAGTHDARGWPTFVGWPVHDTYTHQQTYYVWLKRVWKAGERLVVAQTVEDEPLCKIEPLRTSDCDETAAVERQIARLRALERYVDAQSGGTGRGWFRLVYGPAEARRAIERGKLAVVIGMEASDALGCSERLGLPQCTRADIDRRLDELYGLGLRSMFIAHWVDNAFAGAALEGGAKGQFISAMQVAQTGQPFVTEPCADADESGGQCNSKGLTALGQYLVERLMAKHMLIETDHLSQKARATVLAMAEARRYPLVSSHTGTGGAWTAPQLRRLYAIGGMASATTDTAPDIAKKIIGFRGAVGGQFFCMGLGTDTGGFNDLSGPRPDATAQPLRYPFRSVDGRVQFVRQRSGTRTFDLNTDGVAHYGLFADVVADIQRTPSTRPALGPLFHSAEAYLRMWQRAAP